MLDLPRITDRRGNLTFVQNPDHVPFEIKRLYYLYDVPAGESRGGHAHKILQQLIIAVSGSFDVVVDDGFRKQTFHLFKPYSALLLPERHWRDLENFSSGSVCMVAASHPYEESDYIRDYEEFLRLVGGHHTPFQISGSR
jgi:hypothetical protein